MQHITYLLGAGASRKCLPIVAEMSGRILEVTQELGIILNQIKNRSSTGINISDGNALIQDLKWLSNVCDVEKNFSVDTLAKKLLLSDKGEDYNKLKNTLALYFTLQQKFKSPDVRYDNFWASLLNRKNAFPNNIKILSWNYDFQLELTYQDFLNSNSLIDTSKQLNIVSHQTDDRNYIDANRFTIFKLNGSATYNSEVVKNNHQYVVDNLKHCSNEEAIEKIIKYYSLTNNNNITNFSNHLSYAWEHDKTNTFYKHLESSLTPTTILVVIGYSFPYFNREVDKLILKEYMPNLQRVYFQDEKPENIGERFRAINTDVPMHDLIPIFDTYQFYFPNEL